MSAFTNYGQCARCGGNLTAGHKCSPVLQPAPRDYVTPDERKSEHKWPEFLQNERIPGAERRGDSLPALWGLAIYGAVCLGLGIVVGWML